MQKTVMLASPGSVGLSVPGPAGSGNTAKDPSSGLPD